MKVSDYVERGYAGLHIKKETRQRLNVAKATFQAQSNQFISQDEFINILLSRFDEAEPCGAMTEAEQ